MDVGEMGREDKLVLPVPFKDNVLDRTGKGAFFRADFWIRRRMGLPFMAPFA